MAEVKYVSATRVYTRDAPPAVDALDLDIKDGEFMVLVGPSGSGKTTALRMLAGLEPLDGGRIEIGEKDVTWVPPKDRDIAMVFQNYALYPGKTVAENMGFALKMQHVHKDERARRVREAAKLLDLDDQLLDRKPKALSGGQRQRVAMGRAIVRDPAVFLMDEPLSNLDAKLRVQMRTEVSRIQRRLGTTMVYVTHDQVEAMTLGDRVAVMRTGTIQQVASPQELYDRPANLFVAGFIGSPAMNFMGGTLEEGKLRTGLGEIPLTGRLQQVLSHSEQGRDVIVGIRPEDFEDSALVSSENQQYGMTFPATIDVVESLGSEKYVYFTQELGMVDAAELNELARDSGRADTGASGETVVARLDPATQIGEGDNAQIWVDMRAIHVFDPATGKNLTLGDSGSAASPARPADGNAPAASAAPAQTEAGTTGQDTGSAATPPQ